MDRRKVCRYFERGSCKKQKCPFVHMRETKKNCEFYLKGFCKKGANCNFYHPPKETEEQKQIKKNIKAPVQKQKQHQYNDYHEQQQQIEKDIGQDNGENGMEKQEQTLTQDNLQLNNQQKIQEQQQAISGKQIRNKQYRVRMILGLDESSSQQDSQPLQQAIEPQKKLKPLNFNKIYPKKFIDYSKSAQTKKSILQNEEKYFKGKKFIDFLNSLHDPEQKQYYQIIRKFQDSFKLEEEVGEQQQNYDHQPKLYRIRLRPLLYEPQIHLHFQMVEDNIQIQVDCRRYPQQKAKFQIMNYSIPQAYRQKLQQSLQRIHQKKSIFQTLKTFMNNFQKIYNLSKSKLEDEYFSQIQLQKKIQKTISRQAQEKEKSNKRRKPKKVKKQQTEADNLDVQVLKYGAQEKIVVGNMNYDIVIQSLLINNCEYVLLEKILLFLECRCEKQIIHILQADRMEMKIGIKLKCKKCQIIINLALHREVMQLRATNVGKLGIQNAKLLEVGGISWRVGCSCDKDILKNKMYLPGQRLNTNCHICFKHMSVMYMGLKFFNPFLDFNIIEDKELPSKGTCKHVKLSFRWFRYGCCGRMFSCDECHSNGSIYQHDKLEGITMMCGFCSIQQTVNRECINCKRQLARGIDKSGHWEGGMGCRDQTLLSKKDAKKYSGLTKKK